MTEGMQIAVDLLTALGALGAFAVSLWNAHQVGRVNARVDGLKTAHNAHVNVPGCTHDDFDRIRSTRATWNESLRNPVQPFTDVH